MIVYMDITIAKSSKDDEKFVAKIQPTKHERALQQMIDIIKDKEVHFGQAGASDYTKHKDDERKERYIDRHKKNEDWGKSGVKSAGFWSRWLLWNKKSLKASVSDINQRYPSCHVKLK